MTVFEKMTAIADAIREKTGESGSLTVEAMAEQVSTMKVGGDPEEHNIDPSAHSVLFNRNTRITHPDVNISTIMARGIYIGKNDMIRGMSNLPTGVLYFKVGNSFDIGTGGGGDIIPSYDPVFANNEWSAIIEACATNSVPDTWAIGDSKPVSIGGTEYLIDIIGKYHDEFSDGSGKAPLTLQLHDCYDVLYAMDSSNSNTMGWSGCEMRMTHLPSVLSLMPSEIQTHIKEVNKLTSASGTDYTVITTADKLFLLSEIETFGVGSATNSLAVEGTQYEYYRLGNTTIKNYQGSAKAYWGRSPALSSTTSFCYVRSGGGTNTTGADSSNCIAFAFCLGSSSGGDNTTNIITFTIVNMSNVTTTYRAEAGMTWIEWCDSSYNTGGFSVHKNNYVTDGSGYGIVDDANILFRSPSEVIVANKTYYMG